MSKAIKIDLKALPQQLADIGRKVVGYIPLIFIVLVALVYGFVLLRITMLSSAKPDDSEVSSQVTQLTPVIDESAAQKLQTLEDNSVNVQSIFQNARNNPFGE